MEKRYTSKSKPAKCPKCGSERVARILYGEPMGSEELMADLKAGRIVLGGCCITGDDPAWKCLECEMEIYRKRG
jgi:hypothetical protein